MTTRTATRKITTDEADAILDGTQYADYVEDYEMNEFGHVYQLEDGGTVVVGYDGTVTHHEAE